MRRRVSALTGPLSLSTRDTVATDTPAARATSLIVTVTRASGAGSCAATLHRLVAGRPRTITDDNRSRATHRATSPRAAPLAHPLLRPARRRRLETITVAA